MRLYLAEKPDQARNIARIIGIKDGGDGFITLKNGDVFTWVIGHLLEQCEPQDYKPEWKRWSWAQLPMIPDTWKMNKVKGKTKQLNVISKLLKKADTCVICTDAGREGELIAREVLEFYKFKGNVERLWLQTLVDSDIREALNNILPGSAKEPLYRAALARSHADWLYGMNLSRGATLAAGDTSPVGRVQTPTLAMVVKRDLEIDNFKAKEYYELEATVDTAEGHKLTLSHAPKEAYRIYEKSKADSLKSQAEGASGPLSVKQSKGKDAPQLPFSLSTLQREASKQLGLSASKTLEVAQALYEKKVLSYPRTDCPYLSSAQKPEVPSTLDAVRKCLPDQVKKLEEMGTVLRNRVFDDAKLSDHHGIIPTREYRELNGMELKVYQLVALRFMQAIAPDRHFDATKITMDANGVPFGTSGRIVTSPGWSSLSI